MTSNNPEPDRTLDRTRSLAPAAGSADSPPGWTPLCQQFVDQWRAGQRPRIESFLEEVSASDRGPLLHQLVQAEVALRRLAGEAPALERYLARFPADQATIAQAFTPTERRATGAGERASTGDSTQDLARSQELETHSFIINSPLPAEGPATAERYRKIRQLGEGAFGAVWLAEDLELKRQVALKEPRADRLQNSADLETYLAEARVLASLDHPHIVPVYDVGRTDDGSCYVVSKFIEGTDLAGFAKQQSLTFADSARLVAQIADALQHTHNRGLVHRDIKPANILIDSQNRPYVTDFGLALRDEDFGKHDGIAGSPAYMSPEQARGESHLVDGRSDIFSLGVILYELLTGTRPFPGKHWQEVLQQIIAVEAKPLRQRNEAIPKELERICLKALSKRATDRYPCATDLAEDLRNWSQPTADTRNQAPARIVPKGLRSFDAADSDFFLELLPGPRDRDGLPETLRFWKTRMEETDAERTFRVGLVYGPSGCGKSSLMKAGLLPRLADHVIRIFLEATPDQTESQLLNSLRRACPDLPRDASLVDTLAAIRRGKGIPAGRKVVLVVDQFEQWLYAHGGEANSELGAALRQCDGGRIQTVLLVRDDFWMPISEFLRSLEVRLIEGDNASAVSLFDHLHARKVLSEFGKAYGRLPENLGQISRDQDSFLTQSVTGLSQDGKVISVRLALFSDMMKSRPWTPAALTEVGGTTGVGTTFLEETFSSRNAPPQHRHHQEAARAVLRALLPPTGVDIKGHSRSSTELQAACGYTNRPQDFAELIRILDSEVRLITPVGGERQEVRGEKQEEANAKPESDGATNTSSYLLHNSHYQLTHDYLVPSLRDWLTRKQRETRRGRAELRLAERAAVWGANPENKQLPTLWEWLTIRRLTEKAKWRASEQRLMARASRFHTTRAGLFALSGLMLLVVGLGSKRWNDAVQLERDATNLVISIAGADYGKLPEWIEQANSIRSIVDPKLKSALEQHDLNSDERLKLSLALLPSDPQQLDYLTTRLLSAQANQVPLLVSRLQPYASQIEPQLWTAARRFDPQSLLQTASALAAYAPDNKNWASISPQVADQVVQENPLRIAVWIETLRPAAKWLNPELQRVYASSPPARSQTEIDLATDILQSYAADDFQLLHELVMVGQPQQFSKMFPNYQRFSQQAMDALREELARPFSPEDPEASEAELQRLRLEYIARQANAAVALLRLEDPKPVYEFLTFDRNPEALSQFIYRIRGREVSPSRLISSFQELQGQQVPDDPLLRQQHVYRLYGFILGLGEYTLDQLPAQQRDGLVTQLAEMYGSHPSRAVHSALGWLLRRWGQDELVRQVDETPLPYDESGVREWYVMKIDPPREDSDESVDTDAAVDEEATAAVPKPLIDLSAPIYFTMIVFPGGEFEMGELGDKERVKVAGPIAVSDREVTWRQFSPIDGDTHRQRWTRQFSKELEDRELQPDEPAFGVYWFEAVNYCRWLTEAAGMDESLQSYQQIEFPRDAQSRPGWLELPVATEWPLRLDRPGFRLLREAEWEYVTRAGTETEYSFGDDESLLGEYCWYQTNSNGWSHRTGLLRPSVGGLFDIHGNLWEWTDDWETSGSFRVVRGGGWGSDAADGRTASRSFYSPTYRTANFGFRLALSPSSQERVPAEPGKGAEPAGEGTEGASAEQRPEMP